MLACIRSGAKGKAINIGQIMACVGQNSVEGHRPTPAKGMRMLPSLTADDRSPYACGFVGNSYGIGLDPREFFFHAMGGREGIVDTAVKTSKTGYIHRRLQKALEAVSIQYDGTAREANGNIVQYVYGGDNCASEYLIKCKIPFVQHDDATIRRRYLDFDCPEGSGLLDDEADVQALEDEYTALVRIRDRVREARLTIFCDSDLSRDAHVPSDVSSLLRKMSILHGAAGGSAAAAAAEEDDDRDNNSSGSIVRPSRVVADVNALCHLLAQRAYTGMRPKGSSPRDATNDSAVLETCAVIRLTLTVKAVCADAQLTLPVWRSIIDRIDYEHARAAVNAGEMVGSVASEACAEPAMQMSIIGTDEIALALPPMDDRGQWETRHTAIGPWVDGIIAGARYMGLENIANLEISEDGRSINVLELEDAWVQSVDADGVMHYKRITGVTRHPPNGELVHITTEGGRKITATLTKSLLTRGSGKAGDVVVPIRGDLVEVGTPLPFIRDEIVRKDVSHLPSYRRVIERTPTRTVVEDNPPTAGDRILEGFFGGETVEWDPIASIERVPEAAHEFVYDLSVEGTKNFGLGNGLQARDTLNTFHLAGVASKNVTLGIPRFDEISMCTKTMRTPSMKLPLLGGIGATEKAARAYAAAIEYTMLCDVVESIGVVYDPDVDATVVDADAGLVALHRGAFPVALEGPAKHVIRIVLDRHKLTKRNLSPQNVGEAVQRYTSTQCAEVMASDASMRAWIIRVRLGNVSALVDRDGIQQSHARDIERSVVQTVQNELLNRVHIGGMQGLHGVTVSDHKSTVSVDVQRAHDAAAAEAAATTATAADGGCCESGAGWSVRDRLLERRARKSVTSGRAIAAGRGLYSSGERGDGGGGSGAIHTASYRAIETDGSCLADVLFVPGIDWRRAVSNDIYEVFEVFGIEAASHLLIHELYRVLSFDGTYINQRHLNMVVDWMTCRGKLTSISRHGLNRMNTGPIVRASFEETDTVILEAAAHGEKDFARGISACMTVGRKIPMGTGVVHVMETEAYTILRNESEKQLSHVKSKSVLRSTFSSHMARVAASAAAAAAAADSADGERGEEDNSDDNAWMFETDSEAEDDVWDDTMGGGNGGGAGGLTDAQIEAMRKQEIRDVLWNFNGGAFDEEERHRVLGQSAPRAVHFDATDTMPASRLCNVVVQSLQSGLRAPFVPLSPVMTPAHEDAPHLLATVAGCGESRTTTTTTTTPTTASASAATTGGGDNINNSAPMDTDTDTDAHVQMQAMQAMQTHDELERIAHNMDNDRRKDPASLDVNDSMVPRGKALMQRYGRSFVPLSPTMADLMVTSDQRKQRSVAAAAASAAAARRESSAGGGGAPLTALDQLGAQAGQQAQQQQAQQAQQAQQRQAHHQQAQQQQACRLPVVPRQIGLHLRTVIDRINVITPSPIFDHHGHVKIPGVRSVLSRFVLQPKPEPKPEPRPPARRGRPPRAKMSVTSRGGDSNAYDAFYDPTEVVTDRQLHNYRRSSAASGGGNGDSSKPKYKVMSLFDVMK
jgi:DNA-directed RNA polymerase beta' subunit